MISANDVIIPVVYGNSPISSTCRFLGVDNDDNAILIAIDKGNQTAPFKRPLKLIISALENEEAHIINNYIVKGIVVSEDQMTEKGRKDFKANKENFKPLLEDTKLILDDKKRSEAIQKVVENGVHLRKVLRTYYRYLGSGMNIFSLAPRYKDRGGPQKSMVRRKPGSDGNQVSRPMVEEKLIDGVERYLLKGKRSLKKAYIKTLKKHFKVKGAKFEDEDGNVVPLNDVLINAKHLPTLAQFKYTYLKIKKGGGTREHVPRRTRQSMPKSIIRGSARDLLRGPGQRYEIDATGLQTRLVSRFGRSKLIGSPTLYFVIDAWSGVITGYLLTLHAAGWPAAAKALKNAFMNKEAVFRRLNLNYTSEDWPCHHMCTTLAADRGEMKNLKPEGLVMPGGITLEIGPPREPKWRGTVESTFKNLKYDDLSHIPGRYPKFPRRGDPDGDLTAALFLDEMELIVVETIMNLNNSPAPENIVPEEMMQDPNLLQPTRLEMHKWGLIHRPGFTRNMSDQDVMTFLMTRDKASVTRRGLSFKGNIFFSQRLLDNGMLSRAGSDENLKVDIAYDEHFADVIWFFDPILEQWINAENRDEEVRRKWISFLEHDLFKKDLRRRLEAAKLTIEHLSDQKEKRIKKLTSEASKNAKLAKAGKSKNSLKIGIDKNRRFEMEVEDALLMAETLFSFGESLRTAKEQSRTTITQAAVDPTPEAPAPKTKNLTTIAKNLWEKA
jgi:hypothetical protein